MDETLAVRHGERYLLVEQCAVAEKVKAAPAAKADHPPRARSRGSDWNKNFDLKKAPKVWQAGEQSGYRRKQEVG